ncbi:TerB family tellurite resistance protein [Mucilaginibacter ginkgonis]|uniref:TerB family tellurite resistance protein n=1 Tax=Mucilaginibacter ginkgonis TaxID=2682091 RepID=A0A6I4HVR1_9SPHI|nr:TerB family tellurite resistance protein [Mucilaginibacter ginkgonis]QQL49964.1 TerB family tellurite resistance protein [Mucilaginibacter ginkgonis]
MKKYSKIFMLLATSFALFMIPGRSAAQEQELQQLLLNMEKLTQLKSILSDMQKGYYIYEQGYGAISNLSKGNFDLHDTYLSGLLNVSPSVRNYSRIADIVSMQSSLLREYKASDHLFRTSNTFSPGELNYMGTVYEKLVSETMENVDELATVIAAGKLRMSDAERLKAVDRIYNSSADKLQFLRHFTRQGQILSIQRAKEQSEILKLKKLYGIVN